MSNHQYQNPRNGGATIAQDAYPYRTPQKPINALFPLVLATIIVPTTIFYVFQASSQAIGVAIVSAITIGLALSKLIRTPHPTKTVSTILIISTIISAIVAHLLISATLQPVDFFRSFQSLVIISLMFVGSYLISYNLFSDDEINIYRSLRLTFATFLFVGAMGIWGIRPMEYFGAPNPVFPFTEPSHYALTFTPLLLAYCVTAKPITRVVALTLSFAIAYLLKSLSLIVGSILISLICLPPALIVIAGASTIYAIKYLDLSYFTDRLDLSYQSENLSTLVYIQGWELAQDALQRTHGWGLGFQQLGFGPIYSPTADKILSILRTDTNLKDGGFTVAKLLAEFGVFGFVLICYFTYVAVKQAAYLNKIIRGYTPISTGYTVASAIVVGFSVEMFVRGIGYFSGSGILAIAALCFIWRSNRSTIREIR